jgi:nucleotide-binding universal stress UspA family protein
MTPVAVAQKISAGPKIALKNILFLTDFSEPSEAALPFAAAVARHYGAKVYALNVVVPAAYVSTSPDLASTMIEAVEENAKLSMNRVQACFGGVEKESIIERGIDVWSAVEQAIQEHEVDLIVLGTHGRTGATKFLLGSVAEEIFRRSPVPVLTIGPHVRSSVHTGGRFHRVLLASDFSAASAAAAPYALSLAQENGARLVLLHVMRKPDARNETAETRFQISVAEAIQQLYETVPDHAKLSAAPEVNLEYGDPAERILTVAREKRADLIVLGLRDAAGHIGAATHLERATAHKIVAHANCPVLTVREESRR